VSSEVTAARAFGALFVAMRPHQWTKNLLLFAGLIFAGHWSDTEGWVSALLAFVAFCALSSSGYLSNDVADAARDRLHPRKRFRPVARGDVAPQTALRTAAILAGVGLLIAAVLGLETFLLALTYLVVQQAYTRWLKRVYLVDALTIAGLFVLRAAAGAAAVDVSISTWLLVCTGLLALFLTFAKRRGEALTLAAEPGGGREVMRHYSVQRLGPLVTLSAAATCVAYAVYAIVGRDSLEMLTTLPLVVFGLGRYLWLMQRRDLGEEPDVVLLTDVVLLSCVVLWAAAAGLAISQ
jgi:4-hydroxybenzoate polyprenyltransferase